MRGENCRVQFTQPTKLLSEILCQESAVDIDTWGDISDMTTPCASSCGLWHWWALQLCTRHVSRESWKCKLKTTPENLRSRCKESECISCVVDHNNCLADVCCKWRSSVCLFPRRVYKRKERGEDNCRNFVIRAGKTKLTMVQQEARGIYLLKPTFGSAGTKMFLKWF